MSGFGNIVDFIHSFRYCKDCGKSLEFKEVGRCGKCKEKHLRKKNKSKKSKKR